MKKGNRIETILGNYRGQLFDKYLKERIFTNPKFVIVKKCCKLIFLLFLFVSMYFIF